MWRSILFLIAVTSASKVPVAPLTGCCSSLPDAQETLQTFQFPANSDSPACTCTVKSNTERTIRVSLPLAESLIQTQPTNEQCVQASHDKKSEKICNKPNQNTFTAKKEINITQVQTLPGAKLQDQITIEYQLVNDEQCAPSPKPVGKNEQTFYIAHPETEDIPAGLQCIWRVDTINDKNILVQLYADSSLAENQCVTVSDVNNLGTKEICGKSVDNKFVSQAKGVVIKYGDSSSRSTVKNFQVSYRFEKLEDICGTLQYTAEETAKQFAVSTTEAQKKCTWTIQTGSKRTIRVSLPVVKKSGAAQQPQCVQASHGTNHKKLCDNEEGNKFTSKKSVNITISSEGSSTKSEQKVKIEYQLVNDEHCASALKPAEPDEHTFYISNPETQNIPAGLQCIWHVDTTDGKSIVVQVHADSNAADDQCVSVSDVAQRSDEEICTKSGESQFTSHGQSVKIRYSSEGETVPNFKVSYRSSATSIQVSSFSLIVGLYQIWNFYVYRKQ